MCNFNISVKETPALNIAKIVKSSIFIEHFQATASVDSETSSMQFHI